MTRSNGWLILIALTCGLLGYLVGRQTAPSRHAATDTAVGPAVETPSNGEAMRLWPTVWPDGGAAIGADLGSVFADERISPVDRDVRRRTERIRSRHAGLLGRPADSLAPAERRWGTGGKLPRGVPLILRVVAVPVGALRLRFRSGAAMRAEVPESPVFSARWAGRLKRTAPRAWETPFGAYFHRGPIHELVGGRWLRRGSPP